MVRVSLRGKVSKSGAILEVGTRDSADWWLSVPLGEVSSEGVSVPINGRWTEK